MKTSLCKVEVAVAGFTNEFTHCDQIANYLSTSISLEQPDPFQYSTALSIVLNEVLETLHQSDRPNSMATLEVLTEGRTIHLVLGVEGEDRIVSFYSKIAEEAAPPGDTEELYRTGLLEGPLRREISVYRLLADHGAHIGITRTAPDRAFIDVTVTLDDCIEVAT